MAKNVDAGPDTGRPVQGPEAVRRVEGAGTEGALALPPNAVVEVKTEKKEFVHEALVKEMHKADDLAETHSVLVVTISGAAFAFAATQLEIPKVVYFVTAFGLLVAIEWFLKLKRHDEIFSTARDRLVKIEKDLDITTARPTASLMSGFTILKWLAGVFIVGWILIAFTVASGWLPERSTSASDVFEKVAGEMPKLTNMIGTKWNLISLTWDEQTNLYSLELSPEGKPADKWVVMYDATHRRIKNYKQ
jgi:hypothetical protein